MLNRFFGPQVLRAPEDPGATYDDPDVDLDLELDPDLEDQDDDLDPDLEGQDVDPDPQPEQRTRGANRVAEATRIAAEAKAEAAAARAELERLTANRNRPDPAVEQAQRAERLRMMSPDDRTDYLLAEQNAKFEARLAKLDFDVNDKADAAAFQSLCASNPAAAKMAAGVERALADQRAKGFNVDRTTILKFLIGEKVISGAPKARAKQVNRAASGIARNAARPGATRSDVQSGDRRSSSEAEARRKRLEGMTF